LTVSGQFQQILDYFMVPTILFLALTVFGVFLIRRQTISSSSTALTIPGYPIAPLLFLVPVSALLVLMTLGKPLESSIGLLVVLAGLPVSGWVLNRSRLQSSTLGGVNALESRTTTTAEHARANP
jgi:APA family basic amino acid/polyamine antiporter